MQVDIKVDSTVRGSLYEYTNEASSHKSLNSDAIILTGLASGAHTVELVLTQGSADAQDYSHVTIMELPFS
jgi:hypothetical protein